MRFLSLLKSSLAIQSLKRTRDESDDFTNGFGKDKQRVIVSEGDSSRILGIQGLLHVHLSKLALIFVPRLHCFIHRKLAAHDFLPCSPTNEPKPNLVKENRESLLRHLTAVVGNDGIAANFMLLHLLSKIISAWPCSQESFTFHTMYIPNSGLSQVSTLLPLRQERIKRPAG
ncbi:hypothetical protein ACFX2K_001593 [Malus domestica]